MNTILVERTQMRQASQEKPLADIQACDVAGSFTAVMHADIYAVAEGDMVKILKCRWKFHVPKDPITKDQFCRWLQRVEASRNAHKTP